MPYQRVSSGAPWESVVGYCRALRAGNHIFVSGTAPVADDGTTFAPGDAQAQTRRCLSIILAALGQLGAGPEHVVRTRMFVTDISKWELFGRAHGEVFNNPTRRPATTMVQVSALIAPDMLIEIEADAILP